MSLDFRGHPVLVGNFMEFDDLTPNFTAVYTPRAPLRG